jgi:hypothetical protein
MGTRPILVDLEAAGMVDRRNASARRGRRDLRCARTGVRPLPRTDPRGSGIYGGQYQEDDAFRRVQSEMRSMRLPARKAGGAHAGGVAGEKHGYHVWPQLLAIA